jgi:hypothetical protein
MMDEIQKDKIKAVLWEAKDKDEKKDKMIPKEINADDIPAVDCRKLWELQVLHISKMIVKEPHNKMPAPINACETCPNYGVKLRSELCGDLPTLEERESWVAMMLKRERMVILDKLGNMLNSRIAKMEILDSKKSTQFRKGIIEGYRDIEEWVRREVKKL